MESEGEYQKREGSETEDPASN